MPLTDDEIFKSANSYRLDQDILRWMLLAGYAAYLVAVLRIADDVLSDGARTALVLIGLCYMLILAVENFYYNLLAEHVKDCDLRHAKEEPLRTRQEFSESQAKNVGPFHLSFFFALVVVALGNSALALPVAQSRLRAVLVAANWSVFVLTLLLWRYVVYPVLVRPFQRIFDFSKDDSNLIWRVFRRVK